VYEAGTLKDQSEGLVEKVKKQFLLHRPYFLFVGTLERKKNIAALAQGFDKLLDANKLGVDLVFAGKADRHYPEEKFKALAIKHRDHLVFTGYIDDEVLAALYQGAHAYVNASVHEGFGLPGVEAMRFGIPLAVANSPVFNEVYDDAAVYFNPQDAGDIAEKLRLLASDQQFYEQQQEKAIARGRLFSWERAARETLKILHAASGKPSVVAVERNFAAENT
jgi:glycosyltransferase involved in cell wall biosynthesis